jgi:MoaA/NifB/PqqE/SkfB family radical SAM enzyme
MMVNSLVKYKNGNYDLEILSDGTKIRSTECESFIPKFPESIDVKITNYCSLGCPYCHENSTISGKHADLHKLLNVLDNVNFPHGIELAIGGGNPLDHPDLCSLLYTLKGHGFISNITVNKEHLKHSKYRVLLKEIIDRDLVKGVGVSINSTDYECLPKNSSNIVYHLIAGVNDVKQIESLIELGNCKILVLGYKQFGRGINYF